MCLHKNCAPDAAPSRIPVVSVAVPRPGPSSIAYLWGSCSVPASFADGAAISVVRTPGGLPLSFASATAAFRIRPWWRRPGIDSGTRFAKAAGPGAKRESGDGHRFGRVRDGDGGQPGMTPLMGFDICLWHPPWIFVPNAPAAMCFCVTWALAMPLIVGIHLCVQKFKKMPGVKVHVAAKCERS